MSRLCDRVTRRAPPGLDADLSGLGLSFSYPGNVRFQFYKPGSIPKSNRCRMPIRCGHSCECGLDFVRRLPIQTTTTTIKVWSLATIGLQFAYLSEIVHQVPS